MQEQMLPAKSTSSKMTQRFRHAWPVPGAERRPMWLDSSESRDGKGGAIGEIIRGGESILMQECSTQAGLSYFRNPTGSAETAWCHEIFFTTPPNNGCYLSMVYSGSQ